MLGFQIAGDNCIDGFYHATSSGDFTCDNESSHKWKHEQVTQEKKL